MRQRIGVIFCAWGTVDLLDRSLSPWLSLRMNPAYDVRICAVSVKFAGFEGEDDGTRERLRWYREQGEIDHLISGPDNVPETLARGMALAHLRDTQQVDMTWMVDADEFYTSDEIARILTFVAENPWTAWFRIALKNYVIDDKTYLAEPFCPPRIHRMKAGSYRAHSFSGDNDITYGGTITRDILHQDNFPSMSIPPGTAWVRHESWMNDERGRMKSKYQWARWGNACSFIWHDTKGLMFNPALPEPRVIRENA